MGVSWSRRRNDNNNAHQNLYPSHLVSSHTLAPSSSSSSSSSILPPALPAPAPAPAPNYVYPVNAPYPSPQNIPHNPYPMPPPPPPPPRPYYYQQAGVYGVYGCWGPMMVRPNYYYPNQSNGWPGIRPFQPPQAPPPPYVNHQNAKKIRNDVNVHKDTIKLEVDEKNPEYHQVSFTLDAMVDGSISIIFFAKEGADRRFSPLYPDARMSVKVDFQKGLGQKFHQPSGTGIDLNFFELDDLSKPSPGEDIFPLVIIAEACPTTLLVEEQLNERPPTSNAQITQAVLEKNNAGGFQVKVIRQILSVDGVRYELREIYGIRNSDEESFDDSDPGKECVICMSEPKDTAILPCRHMCVCSECAKELRLRTNKCPICRNPIEELIEIKVSKSDQ